MIGRLWRRILKAFLDRDLVRVSREHRVAADKLDTALRELLKR